jgi:hypothetical protein
MMARLFPPRALLLAGDGQEGLRCIFAAAYTEGEISLPCVAELIHELSAGHTLIKIFSGC